MRIALKETRLGIRNSTTRLPFRYGKACLTKCPQAVLEATIECESQVITGYSGDCFPPGWFDKSPGKSFQQQIDDMLDVIQLAEQAFKDKLSSPAPFFPAWLSVSQQLHAAVAEPERPPLLASFGVSMVERAVMDAMARAAGLSLQQAIVENIFQINAADVHRELVGLQPRDWIRREPLDSVYVRHTVGLSDPITREEISDDERLDDGYPQALEEYIQRTGVRYFKVKVSNQLEHDVQRLRQIAATAEKHLNNQYQLTLDGNEQYENAEEFDKLIEAIRCREELAVLFRNVVAVEQPLERSIALQPTHTGGIRRLGETLPVIIDESDGTLDAYPRALALGYRGVSSKNCKGPIRSLLNAGLTWWHNDQGKRNDYLMTGEDLCCVGVVPVQADLCLAATLGFEHVERNGHHYHPGLSYLPRDQQLAALDAHADFYAETNGIIAPRLADGKFSIGSLQCPGFGFAVLPDMSSMVASNDWHYDSLGL